MIRNIVRTAMIVAMLSFSTTLLADDYNYMTVHKKDATSAAESIELSNMTAFTLNNGKLTVLNGTNTVKTYTLSQLKKITFDHTSTGIREIEAILFSNPVEVYTTTGIHVKSGDADLSGLPHGIYIVKIGGKSIKIVKK